MIEQMIAKRNIHQEKMEANMIAWREVNKAYREATGACLEKMEACLVATEFCIGNVKAETYVNRKKMKACLEKTEAYLERKKQTPLEMANVAASPVDSNGATRKKTVEVTDD
jgi:hypothetical protein